MTKAAMWDVNANYLGDGFIDEDNWDENGETFLGESCDVADETAEVQRNDHQQIYNYPYSDPETERQEIDPVFPGREKILKKHACISGAANLTNCRKKKWCIIYTAGGVSNNIKIAAVKLQNSVPFKRIHARFRHGTLAIF